MTSKALNSQLTSSSVPSLIVALDFPKSSPALALVEQLKEFDVIYKVGLELFVSEGPAFVRELVHGKHRIFLDLKFHDIPNTVVSAVRQTAFLHAEMITLHLAGGKVMVQSVMQELSQVSSLKPKVLGVSVLTSFDDLHWSEVTKAINHHTASARDSALALMDAAASWGMDGVVCSAHELEILKKKHPSLYAVVPGIRPEGFESGDQARVMTPFEAARLGADAIVVGRPITKSLDPKKVTAQILAELKKGSQNL